jgi:hypothetical protein
LDATPLHKNVAHCVPSRWYQYSILASNAGWLVAELGRDAIAHERCKLIITTEPVTPLNHPVY